MSTQISLQLSDRMLVSAKSYAHSHGFDTLQEFIREIIRQQIFERETEPFGGAITSMVSEEALAQNWLAPEEDAAWAHLQEGT